MEDEFKTAKHWSGKQDVAIDEGKFILNVVDNVQFMIGENPDITDYFESEAINQFNYVLLTFQIDCIDEFSYSHVT